MSVTEDTKMVNGFVTFMARLCWMENIA